MLLAATAWSQSFTASIRGTVTDATGAAVPGAKVVLNETDRNVNHPTVTDPQGRYTVTALQPGNYSMSVEATGFRKHVQQQFQMLVQQQVTQDIQLQVGDVSSTVNVESSAPLLNTTIASLGQVIDNKFMVTLPNIGRDSLALAYLTPGVVGSAGRRGDTNTNFSANGSRNSTSDVMVDGVTVTTVEQNSGITDLKYKPSVDSVQEFKMQTNFFPAEYGQTGGAVVNMVTKSGTNQFHGTGFYFLRHNDFNANSWFANRSGSARPLFRRDQFGGVVGGPIKKNKTFFFATFERTAQKSPTSETATFPTALQRDGNFSETRQSNGQMIQMFDPFAASRNSANQVERQPFPGNVIPKGRMDPIALKALAHFPLGNQTTNAVTNNNNWFVQDVNKSLSKQMDFKGDHTINDKMRLTGRFSYAPNAGTPANLFGEGNPAFTFNNGPTGTKTKSIVSEFTRTENATTVWTVRYGLIYSDFHRDAMAPFDLTTLGFPEYMKANATYPVFPTIAPEGFTDIGTEGYVIMDRQEGTHVVSGSVSKFIGGHTIKAGGEFKHNFLDYLQPGYPSGQVAFSSQVTRQLQNVNNNLQGNGLATMLLGWGTGGQFHIDPKVFTRSRYMGYYFQDDWKVSRKLTLNLGLRYEFDIPRWETQDRQSYWDLDQKSPISVPGYDLKGVLKFTDSNRRSPFNGDYNNFSPRLGFAYALDEKTSIRGGWGLLYQLSRATVYGHTGAGFNVNSQPTYSLDSNETLFANLNNPYPQGMLLPPGRSNGDSTYLGLNVGTPVPSLNRNPEYYSWNWSVQRQVGTGVVEVNYTGSRGAHLFYPFTSLSPLPLNVWYPGTPGAFTRDQLNANVPNPFFGVITDPLAVDMNRATIQRFRLLRPMTQYNGASSGTAEPATANSYYHALQMKYEKRFAKGLTFLGHYTWSKMIDDSSVASGNVTWLGGTTSLQNPFNRAAEKSLSAHDIPHRVVLSGAYQLPFGKGKLFGGGANRLLDAFIGGWEMSAFALFQAGNPLQVSQNGGILQNGTQRPNLIGDPSTSGGVVDRLNNGYFNMAAFSQPAPDTFGSAPRYLNYRGPGIKSVDGALLKSWATFEGQRFEFRIEAVNLTNTPMFGDPANAYGNSNFGTITGTKVGARNVQLGLKYYF
jgi:hypothetical protein